MSSIVTYKIKHNADLSEHLEKAKDVARYAFEHKGEKLTSKHVKHIGLNSAISNQILRKYSRNKKIKHIKYTNVKLIVPNQGIKIKDSTIRIVPLKIILDSSYLPKFNKVNMIELDSKYAYIAVTINSNEEYSPIDFIGVDRNATGHIIVSANIESGRVHKYGKIAPHISKKYKSIRKNLQKQGKLKVVKNIGQKESRIHKDINHKISKELVKKAKESKSAIVLENLKGVRKASKKVNKSTRHTISSWSFYQLQQFIEYKAKKHGVPILYIDPQYTSQACAKCGQIGERDRKIFKCQCGHVEHADVNAAFNIAFLGKAMFNSMQNEMYGMGVSDSPKEIIKERFVNLRTPYASA